MKFQLSLAALVWLPLLAMTSNPLAAAPASSPPLAPAPKADPTKNNPAYNPKAARSVHLIYPAPEGTLFYNEVTVEESVPGSYFMACGFTRGYFGIQELGDGSKRVLFSVWDPTAGDNPNAVRAADQVEVLGQGPSVEIKRFGGEGTGGQSFWSYNWKLGNTYKLLVSAHVEGDKTIFTGYFFVPEQGR